MGQLTNISLRDSMTAEPIRFYRANEKPFGVFSNLYQCPIVFDENAFSCAEAAYQYGKPRKPEVRDWLMRAPTPSLIATTAHALLPWDVAPGWSRNRYTRMKDVVMAKFLQNAHLAAILLATGDAEIVESATVNNEVNRRWGRVRIRDEWVGANWLGAILMETRGILREPPTGGS